MNIVLVVVAQTDDETLACGETSARHFAEGDTMFAVFTADGFSSRTQANPDGLANRNTAAEHPRQTLGIHKNFYLGLPDNCLDSLSLIEVIRPLEPIINPLHPNILYTYHYGDLNVNPRITHQIVLTVCRPMLDSTVREIYSFEVMSRSEGPAPSSEPFLSNHYVDLSEYLTTKLEALKAYQVEMREVSHCRGVAHIEHLAHHRSHTVGVEAAEAFMTITTVH